MIGPKEHCKQLIVLLSGSVNCLLYPKLSIFKVKEQISIFYKSAIECPEAHCSPKLTNYLATNKQDVAGYGLRSQLWFHPLVRILKSCFEFCLTLSRTSCWALDKPTQHIMPFWCSHAGSSNCQIAYPWLLCWYYSY